MASRRKASATQKAGKSPAQEIASFLAKFEQGMARHIRGLRAALRQRFPTANELVYDNYNFLVFGYSSTERPSDCIVSLAANAHGGVLSFYYGSTLPDPKKLLSGSGNQNRFIRLASPGTLKEPDVESLVKAAIAQAKAPLPRSGKGRTIIKSISGKQRPRRNDSK